ncbi:MAG: hypothetical protein AB7F41_04260 [Methylocystis sp.]
MSPFSDRLFIKVGSLLEGAAEGRYAIGALTIALVATIIMVALDHC